MPLALGGPGFEKPLHERVAVLVAAVGGPTKAAALIGRTRAHIDNMRKPGARLRLDDLLPLCEQAGVSLDWVATGYQVRPDMAARHPAAAGFSESGSADLEAPPGFVRLAPVRPTIEEKEGASIEKWEPSGIAVSAAWLEARGGLTSETARYAIAADDGMAPLIRKGAMVIVDDRPNAAGSLRSGVYLVEAGADELLVRRLYVMPGGRIELTADGDANWRYSPAPDAALRFRRVVWAGQDI